MSKLKWGILSTGRISDWFCGDFHKVTDAELGAVCSRTMAAANSFADTHAIPKRFNDYAAMLADDEIDVIYIGTPHTLHHDNAADALRAGKAVLCEKPLTVGAGECASLLNIADKSGAYIMEAMWTWFLPAMATAKAWVKEGRIGEIVQIKTDFGYPIPYDPQQREYDASLGGGCLLEMGIYPVAIAQFFAEQEPTKVYAAGSRAPNGVEHDVTAIFEYDHLTATIGTSFRSRMGNGAYIIGTDGYIYIPDAFRATECSLYRLDDRIDHFVAERETRGYEYQAISVCQDLRTGKKQSDKVSLASSLAFQRTIDAIKEQLS